MAGALTAEVIHDGDDAAITGGVYQWDTSGTGVGPNMPVALMHGVYRSTPATIADGSAGDILVDSAGRLIVASHAVTNAGTFVVQMDGTALTALQLIDDPVFADNAAFTPGTSKVMVGGGVYQSSPATLSNNDAGAVLLDSTGRLVPAPSSAQLVDDSAWTVGSSSGVAILGVHDATATTRTPTAGEVAGFSLDPNANVRIVLPTTTWVSSTFNRPADTTAYTANDAVGSSTTAGSVALLNWTIPKSAGTITKVRFEKNGFGDTPTFRVWLFSASLTPAAGDNAAFSAPLTNFLEYVDVTLVTGTDVDVGVASCSIPVNVGTVYALLQTLTAWTPASSESIFVDIAVYPG